MKYLIVLIIISFSYASAREIGQTEITAKDGVEVFQSEKFYLLKKDVRIISDSFSLYGDTVKMYFEEDLYDVKKIDAFNNVILKSNAYNIDGKGNTLIFFVEKELLIIEGQSSELITKDTKMFSDGKIQINNITGEFTIEGPNSSLVSEEILIEGYYIDGIFSKLNEENDIVKLQVIDENIAFIKSENTDMYAKQANYKKETSVIYLEDSVKIIRDGETITGDHGTLDTKNNSYKVKSKDSNKVKVLLSNKDE